ncbi:MAG: hypothetical protein ACFFDH_22930 [Promethearchaeota archaeon]
MQKAKSNLLTLAKYVNQELLIEELFRVRGLTEDSFSRKYRKKKRIIKIKIIFTKIFYSIIFGILPVIPLLSYFEVQAQYITDGITLHIVIFGGSLLYSFFFILQLLNILFMGMIEISLIMSKNLFFWLETLPLSAEKLKKLKLIAIFHNLDIPIVVITLAFPIVILIGTLNFVIFLISLGMSILQIIFAFNILILVANRINKSIDINQISSRKSLVIRLINIFGFTIAFFGSFIFVQWLISSIDFFFSFPIVQQYPHYLNLILCTIPYPFSPSYLISFLSNTNQIHFHYWISLICGLGLLAIFDYWLSKRSLKVLDRVSSFKGEATEINNTNLISPDIIHVQIKKPIVAYLIKDFKIIMRNLKVFLSIITPIIISFVFTYTFNFTVLGIQTPITTDIFYNWSVILSFQPVISGMIIYNLINIGSYGKSVLAALPINSKDQAKSKLFYFIIIQTIAVISPYLIYIFQPEFMVLLESVILSLPFAWFILISMFEMYVYSFGRKKYKYVLEPVKPDNKWSKWASIYFLEYCFYIFLVLFGAVLNYNQKLSTFIIFYFTTLLCYGILYLMFKIMFSSTRKKRIKFKLFKIKKSNYFVKHPWLAILLLLVSNFLLVLSISFYILDLYQLVHDRFYRTIFWIFLFPIIILIFIKAKFIPKDPIKKFKRPSRIFISIVSGIIGAIYVINFHMFSVSIFSIPQTAYNVRLITISSIDNLYRILSILIFAIWHGILFRGILLPILLLKYKKIISIFLDVSIIFFYYFIYGLLSFIINGNVSIPFLLFNLIYMLCINVLLSYLFVIQKNVYFEVIMHTITILFGALPLFYFGIYIFFPNFM